MLKRANIGDEYPEQFRKAISHIRKKEGYDFSITELMKPLQAIHLSHNNDYEIDALQNTAALLGTAFHNMMEVQDVDHPEDYIIEKRFFKTVEGRVVSGQLDMYHKPVRILWDYKTTGMYKVSKALKSADLRVDARDWVIQTNCYRYMSELPCDGIKILAVMKDFKYDNYYGIKKPAVIIDIPKVSSISIERWLVKRVRAVNMVLETGKYPECTEEDTWNGIRCKDWCDVRHLCNQCKRKGK